MKLSTVDRQEGNDQESIQLLTPSVPRHKRERSNGTKIKTLQAESQKDSFFPKTDQTTIQK